MSHEICIKLIAFNISAYEALKELRKSIEVLRDLQKFMAETLDVDKLHELSNKYAIQMDHVRKILMKLIENTSDFDIDMR